MSGRSPSTSNNTRNKPVSFQRTIQVQNKPPSLGDVDPRVQNSMPMPLIGYSEEAIEEAGTTPAKPMPVGDVTQVENTEEEPIKEAEPVQEDETSPAEPMSGPPISTGRWRPRFPRPSKYDTHSTSESSLVQDVEKMNIETIEEAETTPPKPTPVGYVAQVENKEDEPLKEAEPVQEDETSPDEPMSGPPISTGVWRPRFPRRSKYDAHSTSEPSLVQDVEKMNLETIEEAGTTPAMPTLVGDVAQVENKEDEPLKEAEPVQEDETSPAKPMSGLPISTSRRRRSRFSRFYEVRDIRTPSSSQDTIQVSTDMVIKEAETPFDMPTSIQDVKESNIETDKEAGTTSAKPTSAGDVTHKE